VTGRALRRYLDDLLGGRRPRGFRATDEDAAELRAALTLRAGRPGDDGPDEGFVAALHQRLAAELADPQPTAEAPRGIGRRGLVAGGVALAAASAAVGALVDRAVLTEPGAAEPGTGPAADTLTPTRGDWRTVAASDELPEGAVRAFDLGAVVGFVRRTDGVVRAVSGTCTHQGCRLLLDTASRQLDCPCHTTVFALSGELVEHQLPVAPAPLPGIAARELDGAVQVYTPQQV
jgi:nitrite reductase/ring-hydroxylating ferredoxin subunit